MTDEDFLRLKYEVARFQSHFDSESRAREHLKERASIIERNQERIETKVDDLLTKWNNGGIPINMKVDRLINDKGKMNWKDLLLILSILANLFMVLK